MKKSVFILSIIFSFYACQNTEEDRNIETIVHQDTSSAKTLDDSTLQIVEEILSYEHNFNVALTKKIRDKGFIRGMQFCQPDKINTVIKNPFSYISRVSLQPINLANKISKEDSMLITVLKKQRLPYHPIKKQDTLFYPIQMNEPLCLACHGKPYIHIEAPNYTYIKEHYSSHPKAFQLKEIMGYWKFKLK